MPEDSLYANFPPEKRALALMEMLQQMIEAVCEYTEYDNEHPLMREVAEKRATMMVHFPEFWEL